MAKASRVGPAKRATSEGGAGRPHLGMVCITHSSECRFKTLTRSRFLSLEKAEKRVALEEVYWANIGRLHGALSFCSRKGIRLYRMTSALFPMSDEPLGTQVLESFKGLLSSFGRRTERLGIRVLIHPDQFVVLNSESEKVAATSRTILEKHGRALDLLGLPQSPWSAMIIHGGKSGRADELVAAIRDLPPNVRDRLVLENDEYAYGAAEILDICSRAKVPMVFDAHHHLVKERLNDYCDPSIASMTEAARTTWGKQGEWQIVHLSNGDSALHDRQHSDFITAIPPAFTAVPWIEVEARGKELAIEQMISRWDELIDRVVWQAVTGIFKMRANPYPGESMNRSPHAPSRSVICESLEDRRLFSVVVGVTPKNQLLMFNDTSPANVFTTVKLKGLAKKEALVGIDFRPATGELYGVGNSGRLYTLDLGSGKATQIGSPFSIALVGSVFSVDFDPTADKLRVVSGTDQNLVVDPTTGVATAETAIAFNASDVHGGTDPNLAAVTYSDNRAGGTATTAYGIDSATNTLVTLGSATGSPDPASSGQLFTVGNLGITPLTIGGIDITTSKDGATNTAFAAFTTQAKRPSQLYSVNLTTGAVTVVGDIGKKKSTTVTDIAVAPRGNDVLVLDKKGEVLLANSAVPNLLLGGAKVTGIPKRDKVVAIDRRLSNGNVYALTSSGQLLSINLTSVTATPIGGTSAVTLDKKAEYDIDFNPVTGHLRVVNTSDQNLQFDADAGTVIDFDTNTAPVDPAVSLAYISGDAHQGANPEIGGAAYSSNVAGATTTTLYGIDSNQNTLVRIGSAGGTPVDPDLGLISTIGALGVNVNQNAGFDIDSENGTDVALAYFQTDGHRDGLYSVNLTTGQASFLGSFNKRVKNVVDVTLLPTT